MIQWIPEINKQYFTAVTSLLYIVAAISGSHIDSSFAALQKNLDEPKITATIYSSAARMLTIKRLFPLKWRTHGD